MRPELLITFLLCFTMWLCDLFLWPDLRGMLLFIFAVLLLVVYFLHKKDPPNFPPGPPALPVLGNVFSIESKQPHIYLTKLADVYGNVFCICLGRHKTVFVSGWKMVKEALVTQADSFVDRPYSPMVTRIYSGNSAGLFFSNGRVWRRQRRFAMTTLRTFGLAKSSVEQSICDESQHLQEAMEEEEGEPFDPVPLLNNAVANIICQIVFGRRFDYNDHNFQSMLKNLTEMAYLEGSIWALLYDAFPALMKHLPGPHNGIFSSARSLEASIRREIERHKLELDPSNPRDYIDNFLIEEKHNRNSEEGFDEGNLALCCLDLFLAGSETTSKTLQWGLIYLIQNPHIQGRRACLGEGLARTELFLFFVSLLQRFNFSTLDGVELSTEGITGATRTPFPFKIYAKSR
uniref:Cytochrome P450, family 2, subfamily N, polypeptide 13 n=1 Tax=Amphiprion ocellaris TaxID=80972 RepID=A0A3Q1C4G0_AMPOC